MEFGTGIQGIEMTSCAGRSLFWASQSVVTTTNTFDTVWSPGEPNIARAVGTVDDTTFSATISCVSGPGSGTLNASGGGGTYRGQWSFAGRQGNLTVVRR